MNQTTQRILDATSELYLGEDAGKVTMEDVAQHAGIGRATIYRHFTNRDELLITLIERESRDIARRIQSDMDSTLSPGEYVIDGMVRAVDAISGNALLRHVSLSADNNANRILFDSDRITAIGVEIMQPVIENADLPELEIGSDALMEWIIRMLISFISIPSPLVNNKRRLRKLLRGTLLPVIGK